MKMKKTKIIIGISILVIILAGAIFLNKNTLFKSPEGNEVSETGINNEVTLIIDKGENSLLTINSEFKEGMTVLSLLQETVEKLNLEFQIKNFDIGVMIESIDSKKNGEGGKYWMYYVNGVLPMISADKNILKVGDKVELKFEKSSF